MKRFEKPHLIYYGHPILHAVSEPVGLIDHHIEKLAKQIVVMMRSEDGVGLAAPQAAIPLRLFVIKIRGDNQEGAPIYGDPEVMINPSFEPLSDQMLVEIEGCLSIPGYHGPVSRYREIEASWTDLRSRHHTEKMVGWRARVFQHELDHLNGIFFIDEGRLLETHREEAQKFIQQHCSTFAQMNSSI